MAFCIVIVSICNLLRNHTTHRHRFPEENCIVNEQLITLLNTHRQWWQDPIHWAVIAFATVLHGVLLSIHFGMPNMENASNKDTTIAVQISPQKIKDADFLAQQDQQGDGESESKQRQSDTLKEPVPDTKVGDKHQESLQELQKKQELNFDEKVLMTVLSWQKQNEEKQRKKQQEELERQAKANAQMIASIEAQYLQRQQDLSRMQETETVSSLVTAKQEATAPYLERFRQKVELYGNRDYPEQAKIQGLAGEVRLMVILNSQGGIRDIRLMKSSGHDILDKAAIDSVKKSAPFGVFDEKLREKHISELRIIRTWRFDPAGAEFNVSATE